MQRLPPTPSQDEILIAIDRLGAGFGSMSRYTDMSMGRAQDVLKSAVHELIELRSESRRYICTKCKNIYEKAPNVLDPICPTCETLLRPEAVILRAMLDSKIEMLNNRVQHLEESLMAVLDLGVQ